MKSIFSPNVQENKVSSPKIQTQHIIKQHASACVQSHFSRVRLLETPWTIAKLNLKSPLFLKLIEGNISDLIEEEKFNFKN